MSNYKEDVCPVCGHDDNNDFEYGIPDVVMSDYVAQDVECNQCGSTWIQVYDLVFNSIQNINK